MTKKKLYDMIESLTGDIEFEYDSIHGAVCPFSRSDISVSYGDNEHSHNNIDDAINDKMFGGKSLNEIADQINIL